MLTTLVSLLKTLFSFLYIFPFFGTFFLSAKNNLFFMIKFDIVIIETLMICKVTNLLASIDNG